MDNWLVSIIKNGKVVELYFSDDLRDLDTIRAMHSDCDVEFGPIECGIQLPETFQRVNEVRRKLGRRVMCKETHEVYLSVKECSNRTGIPAKSIYESIRLHISAKGKNFIYFD